MRFINTSDLRSKSNGELLALIQKATEILRYMKADDPDFVATIHIIQVIKRTLAARQMSGPQFRP